MFTPYVPTQAAGKELRVFVINGKAVACSLRKGLEGALKLGFSWGATAEHHPITAEIADIACRAAAALQLDIAGVDLLFDGQDYFICEVNSCPGWKGMQKCHPDINLADMILDFILQDMAC